MKYKFLIIKVTTYIVASSIAVSYWKKLGWWFLIVCACFLFVTNTYINKRIEANRKQEFLGHYPIIKKLKEGQLISVKLKDGRELQSVRFVHFNGSEILVKKPKAEVVRDIRDIKWIKLKNVVEIKSVDTK